MGEVINKKTSIDAETGEIIHERSWVGYDGFTNASKATNISQPALSYSIK